MDVYYPPNVLYLVEVEQTIPFYHGVSFLFKKKKKRLNAAILLEWQPGKQPTSVLT